MKYFNFYKKALIFSILLFFFGLKFINLNAHVNNNEQLNFCDDAKSSILIECKTNTVLYKKNENERLAPASMTKIMTMILVMEKIENNVINLNDIVTTPKEAANLGGSQIYLSEGEEMSVRDLLKAMCIASANDAAMSLAVHIGGSSKNFVSMMNDKVQELGLKNTNFVSPYGFDDENHYSSCYDMAILSSYLINNYPSILEYTSIYEDYVREDTEKRFWLVNTNKLVKFVDGVDGLKTGWTTNSGYCLTATISKNNERFIVVNMGNSSPSIRNKEVTELLQYGINNFETIKLISKDEIIEEIYDITKKPNKIILKTTDDVYVIRNKNESKKEIKIVKNINLDENDNYIDVYYDNLLYKRVRLSSDQTIKKANIYNIFYHILKSIFSN